MKNKLRAIANWILVLTVPLWWYVFLMIAVYRDMKENNTTAYKRSFIEGKDWFWE